MNNNYHRFGDRRDYYQRNQPQDRRYPNAPYRSQSSNYGQHYNNSYEPYQQNSYDSYSQRYQSYGQGYNSYQQQQQQYQYDPNMYNQVPQQHPPPQQYSYDQSYSRQQYHNMPPGDLAQSQQQQNQIPNDQDYMNSQLIDFRGRLHEYIPYAAPRRAIVRLYSGQSIDDWLITEIISNMKSFIEYKAGVTFLLNIQSKMTYKSQPLVDAIVNNYENILKTSEGYKLFSRVCEDITPEILNNIAQWCFDLFLQYPNNDPEYINLLSVFVRVLCNNPNCYLKMINLNVYLSNPPASVIGAAIIENCPENVVNNFIYEINNNLNTLLNDKDLSELVNSLLIRDPKNIRDLKNVRDLLFNFLFPQIDAFIAHNWRWKVCYNLLDVLSMDQKYKVADRICRNCSLVREKHMDDLIYRALLVVNANIRQNSLLGLLNPILENRDFPKVNDFIRNMRYADFI
ncbi:hypothetical protein M9Y10_005586 [Tritrichomonas musculus]|uniref:Uncharacterized protein n=1 Tax=Tritrichomonas musculus TaxID=1915356 RepID=A0ABR2JCJ3_9EUKA